MNPNSLNDFPSVVTYLERVGGEARSMKLAVVKEIVGEYWIDKARIYFNKEGFVSADLGYEATADEQAMIKAEFSKAQWPELVFPTHLENLPAAIRDANPEDVFEFRDEHGKIVMLQVRKEVKGQKSYMPYTYYNDGKWRCAEPDQASSVKTPYTEGKIPLWGIPSLKGNTTVFISEGGKAARAVERLINPKTAEEKAHAASHPWSAAFKHAASVGFIGGALSSHRTDWSVIKRMGITRAIIIPDNDDSGRSAVAKIAEELDCITTAIQFSDAFGSGHDMADPFPETYFKEIKGRRYWVGPQFRDCLIPATFMTRILPTVNSKGKDDTMVVLRNHAKNLWAYIQGTETWIHAEMPDFQMKTEALDSVLEPFSHSPKTSKLLSREFTGLISNVTYRPDKTDRRILTNGKMAINLYQPGNIEAQPGDITPFKEFMDYLIPDEVERKEVEKWVATLIAQPANRILYGLLLISSAQGIGKTFLGEKILAPILGHHNVSFPNEETVMGIYNNWVGKKRLAICGELYAGSSFKMYNRLKQLVTDQQITLREMYCPPINMENWCHIYACSNSLGALRIENSDRRWLIPTINEKAWPQEKFDEFLDWVESGGLSIVINWAKNYPEYIRHGSKAPSTSRKSEMIEASRSKANLRCEELALLMNENEAAMSIPDAEIQNWLEAVTKERVYESLLDIRKILRKHGAIEAKEYSVERLSYNSRMQNFMLNKSAATELEKIVDVAQRKDYVRSIVRKPNELMRYED